LTLKNEKRKRQRILNLYVKAWKDHLMYNRQLMKSNTAAINFVKQNKNYLLRNLFDALRIHREVRKLAAVKEAVIGEFDVAI
jgi:hypothetical protein